jgi:CRP-like cAMP-binding protein
LGDTLIELTPNEKEIYVLVAGTVRLSANLSDGPKILEGREILGRSGVFL